MLQQCTGSSLPFCRSKEKWTLWKDGWRSRKADSRLRAEDRSQLHFSFCSDSQMLYCRCRTVWEDHWGIISLSYLWWYVVCMPVNQKMYRSVYVSPHLGWQTRFSLFPFPLFYWWSPFVRNNICLILPKV